MDNNWSIQKFWNETSIKNKTWEVKPRDYVYATEIGSPLIEVYWKLKGEPITNEFSDTIARKMEAGNFIENFVVWVFKRCGILKEWQGVVRFEHENYLPIHGKFDVLAGCDNDWKKRKEEIDKFYQTMESLGLDFPYYNIVKEKSYALLEGLAKEYPDGLGDKIYEIKSLNSLAFWADGKPIGQPYPHHKKQLSFYQIMKSLPGSFLYIDRDTMYISELPNIVTEEIKKEIKDWLRKITYYYRNNIEPPKPELIVWDDKHKKWVFNWEVERSVYRDKIIGGNDKLIEIVEEINRRNTIEKEKQKLDMVAQGKDFRGKKKYQEVVEYLFNPLISKEELSDKFDISIEALEYYEKTYSPPDNEI